MESPTNRHPQNYVTNPQLTAIMSPILTFRVIGQKSRSPGQVVQVIFCVTGVMGSKVIWVKFKGQPSRSKVTRSKDTCKFQGQGSYGSRTQGQKSHGLSVAVSHGYDTYFQERLVMGYADY